MVVSWYVWHQTKKIVVPWSSAVSCCMLSCRVVSHMCELSYRRHDTTRQHATRPVFSLPIQLNGSVHTCAARPSLVITTKSCGTKNRSGNDFCRVSQREYQENTAKENSFNRNLTWVYKFTMQEYSLKSQYLQINVTQVVVL